MRSNILFIKTIIIGVIILLLPVVVTRVVEAEHVKNFDINKHGFGFTNSNWKDICVTLVDDKIRYVSSDTVKMCFDEWGLCGGMSLLAGERFALGQESIELDQNTMKRSIVDAQIRTVSFEIVEKWCKWIASPDTGHWHDINHSVGYRMKEDWNNLVKPRLDRGEPVVIGLVRSKRASLVSGRSLGALKDLTKQHIVLAIGYSHQNGKVSIKAYDPNYPRREISLEFTSGETGVEEKFQNGKPIGRTKPRGIMFVHSVSISNASTTCKNDADCLPKHRCVNGHCIVQHLETPSTCLERGGHCSNKPCKINENKVGSLPDCKKPYNICCIPTEY